MRWLISAAAALFTIVGVLAVATSSGSWEKTWAPNVAVTAFSTAILLVLVEVIAKQIAGRAEQRRRERFEGEAARLTSRAVEGLVNTALVCAGHAMGERTVSVEFIEKGLSEWPTEIYPRTATAATVDAAATQIETTNATPPPAELFEMTDERLGAAELELRLSGELLASAGVDDVGRLLRPRRSAEILSEIRTDLAAKDKTFTRAWRDVARVVRSVERGTSGAQLRRQPADAHAIAGSLNEARRKSSFEISNYRMMAKWRRGEAVSLLDAFGVTQPPQAHPKPRPSRPRRRRPRPPDDQL